MDYRFTKEQQALRERTAAFAEKEIPRELARDIDKKDEFPHELMRKLGEQGFFAINVPKEYGGDGGNIFDLMIY